MEAYQPYRPRTEPSSVTDESDGAAKSRRVVFERGYDAQMMAIDGTWRRVCKIEDISDTGAKLSVEGSIDGRPLKEFFELLSSTGTAFRRLPTCRVNGDTLGVFFKRAGEKKSQNSAGSEVPLEVTASPTGGSRVVSSNRN